MSKTKIEWATHTVNWLAGCSKVPGSKACAHCYAETMSARLATMPHAPARYRDGVVEGRRWTGRVSYDAEALRRAFQGLRNARKPRRVFVNSMSDTFHENAPRKSLEDLHDEIRKIEWARQAMGESGSWPHVIMLLTKRADRLLAWQRECFPEGLPSWAWVGVTVEDQERADERVPVLLQVRTEGVRFLSCEPMVGAVDLTDHLANRWGDGCACPVGPKEHDAVLDQNIVERCPRCNYALGGSPSPMVHWVIVGGESGRKARPMHPDWARSLRDQCAAAGVAFHFKQHGEWAPRTLTDPDDYADTMHVWRRWQGPDGWENGGAEVSERVGKKAAGRHLDGVTHDEVPRD